MDYKELNDNELVYLCGENNEDAYNVIIDKYNNCIFSTLKSLKKKYNVIGIEVADLYQEGLVGLMQAINTYNKQRDVLFYTYANACIKKSILSAIKRTFEKKNRILNNSYSLDNLVNDSKGSFYEIFKDESSEPNKILINKEEEKELFNKLKSKLSENEIKVFELKIKGYKNEEVANIIKKDKKYVENTLFRINKKYKDFLSKDKISA